MKIGMCGSILSDLYEKAAAAGFDYFECSFSDMAVRPEADVLAAEEKIAKIGLPVLGANGLLKGGIAVVGENITPEEELRAYLTHGFSVMQRLGVKRVVFGSGMARKIPEGFGAATARRQLLYAAKIVGDIAAEYGCLVVMEPLCHYETNLLNSVAAGAAFVRELNHPSVKLLADSYHMRVEDEDFAVIGANADILEHAHIAQAKAGSNEVRSTLDCEDIYNARAFIEALKECGYKGGVSVEASGKTGDWETDLADSVKALRTWLK